MASASAGVSAAPRFLEISSSSPYYNTVMEKLKESKDFDFSNPTEEFDKIAQRQNRTIEVLIKENLPIGALVYKNSLDDQYPRIGKCLAVRAFVLLNQDGEIGDESSKLTERAIEVARAKHADGIYTKTIGNQGYYPILTSQSFKTARVWQGEKNIRLMHRPLQESSNGTGERANRGTKRTAEPNHPQEAELKRARATFAHDIQPQREPKTHSIPLKNPYLSQISRGLKTIEGRINSGMMRNLKVGDQIRFFNQTGEANCVITAIRSYSSFGDMLKVEGVQKCLPNVHSLQEGVAIYDRIPRYPEKARQFGVLAIEIQLKR